MNGITRTLRALEYQPVDRPPVVGGFNRNPDFLAHAAGVSVEEFWQNRRGVAIEAFRRLGADVIINLILSQPGAVAGAYYHAKPADMREPEDVVRYIAALPPLEEVERSFDFAKTYDEYARCVIDGQREMGDMLWIPNSFASVSQFQNEGIFGAENYYMALALYPEVMEGYFRRSATEAYLRNTAIAEAMVKENLPLVIWAGQDCCDNNGPYVAPAQMAWMYLRHVQRSLEPLKAIGVKVIWHADGNFVPIVPYLIEAGIDGFQGVQETYGTKIDLAALAETRALTGARVIIVGSVSSVTTMPFGTPEAVRQDVLRLQRLAAARGGGVLINTSSSTGPEVSMENLYTFFDAATTQP